MRLKDSKKLFTALADDTRLRILNLLGEGELCVCDLMCVLKEPQSKISRHLAYLRKAGLVQGRKEGLWMHYRLSKTGAGNQPAALKAALWPEVEEFKNDLKALDRNRNCLVGCCR